MSVKALDDWETVQILIRYNILQYLACVYTVCSGQYAPIIRVNTKFIFIALLDWDKEIKVTPVYNIPAAVHHNHSFFTWFFLWLPILNIAKFHIKNFIFFKFHLN